LRRAGEVSLLTDTAMAESPLNENTNKINNLN